MDKVHIRQAAKSMPESSHLLPQVRLKRLLGVTAKVDNLLLIWLKFISNQLVICYLLEITH